MSPCLATTSRNEYGGTIFRAARLLVSSQFADGAISEATVHMLVHGEENSS